MRGKKRVLALIMVVALLVTWFPQAMCMEQTKININEASVKELMQLNKIGEKSAEKIVAFREQNGPFKAPQDLTKVKGVGSKIFEMNRERIVIE